VGDYLERPYGEFLTAQKLGPKLKALAAYALAFLDHDIEGTSKKKYQKKAKK
jgi:hypothetical protein